MNQARAESEFKAAISLLLQGAERAVSATAADTYAGANELTILEHNTRRFFLDGLLEALGWKLGVDGNVAEEARVKADTTTFLDYAGVHPGTRTPLLIVEAKSWDAPFIAKRSSGTVRSGGPFELLIQGAEHVRAGGSRNESPVILEWHDHLVQIAGYVRDLKDEYRHEVARVVLTSGQWMVVFESPAKTFAESKPIDERQFHVFRKDEYVSRSAEILDLLSHRTLVGDIPSVLRPTQLGAYISQSDFKSAFHAVHVRYEETGSSRFERRPRVLVYPAVIFLRGDGALITVIQECEGFLLDHFDGSVRNHLEEVFSAAKSLLEACEAELGVAVIADPLSNFPGFPARPSRRSSPLPSPIVVIGIDDTPGEWILATGVNSHYLLESPQVNCGFHGWGQCRSVDKASGVRAINARSVRNPRAYFTDNEVHHCAHVSVLDRREKHCRIAPVDERTCCQACIYLDVCWTESDRTSLPCGS